MSSLYCRDRANDNVICYYYVFSCLNLENENFPEDWADDDDEDDDE